jgi:hypothetical protein
MPSQRCPRVGGHIVLFPRTSTIPDRFSIEIESTDGASKPPGSAQGAGPQPYAVATALPIVAPISSVTAVQDDVQTPGTGPTPPPADDAP